MHKFLLGMAAVGVMASVATAAPIFSDDFSETDGTLLDQKLSDIGGRWVVTTNSTPPSGNNLDVQAGQLSTVGEGRAAFVAFTRPLAAGDVINLSFTLGTETAYNDGYGGVSLYSGTTFGSAGGLTTVTNQGTERVFVGDRGDSMAGAGTVSDNPVFGQSIQSAVTTLPANVRLNYVFDTGAVEFFVNGTSIGTGNFGAGGAFNALRIANGSNGDIQVDNLVVDVVPEPASLGLLGLSALAMLRRRRA